jgi:hypothetical protein
MAKHIDEVFLFAGMNDRVFVNTVSHKQQVLD